MRLNATVNSPYYIENQWEEINSIALRKRSLVHELAEQQKIAKFTALEHSNRDNYSTI
jgi:hypothetical protein